MHYYQRDNFLTKQFNLINFT